MGEADLARWTALVEAYVRRLRPDDAEAELARIRSVATDELSFSWFGSTRAGEPHAYRIEGPDFAIEYDNGQPGADHVHTLWRRFDRDFGGARGAASGK
jgi:hypothetical protein